MELKDIPTCKLIEELKKREGVEHIIESPYEYKKIEVEGPVIMLKVVD